MYLGLGSWRLQCFWTWPFVFSNRAFVLDETDYVWSALSSCTTKCQLLHALAYVEMNANNHTQTSQASSNAKPYLCTATCIPMYTHMYVVCEKECALVCGCVEGSIWCFLAVQDFYNNNYKRDFRIKVSSYCNTTASSRHIRALLISFQQHQHVCALERLSLLFLKRKSKVVRNLLNIYKQQNSYVILTFKSSVRIARQRVIQSILQWVSIKWVLIHI